MYERLIIVIFVAAFSYLSYWILHRSQLRRAQNASTNKNNIQIKAGSLHIVYFWSEGCSQCINSQKPTLDKFMATVNDGNIELISICVDENNKLAKSWGVRTLPTTYIIDEQGNVSHINSGFVSELNLKKQLNLSTLQI
jgi:thioredoxin-like negative regulator of GroEL